MSLPNHHVPDEELVGYAAGTISEAVCLLVATHLALCPSCRKRASELESIGGALLDQEDAAVDESMLDGLLGLLDEPTQGSGLPVPDAPNRDPARAASWLPEPLRSYVGAAADLKWTWVVPGVRQVVLSLRQGEEPVRLLKLQPGIRIPKHSHTGMERLLVLTGGFSDDAGHFGRGDLSVREDDSAHVQDIAKGEPCIALLVSDGPLVPKSLMARVMSWVAPL